MSYRLPFFKKRKIEKAKINSNLGSSWHDVETKTKKKIQNFRRPAFSPRERLNGSRPSTSTIQPLAARSPLFNWRPPPPPFPPPAATLTTPKGFHSSSLFLGGNLCLVWRSACWAILVFGSFFSYLAAPNFYLVLFLVINNNVHNIKMKIT